LLYFKHEISNYFYSFVFNQIEHMKKRFYAIAILFLVACGTGKPDAELTVGGRTDMFPEDVTIEEYEDEIIVDVDQERPVYRASETILTDLVHTKLEVNFDWAKSRMNGVASITAKPHFYASDSLILDAKGMDILKVQLEGRDLAYSYDSSYLKIKLNKSYTRNDKYTVMIKNRRSAQPVVAQRLLLIKGCILSIPKEKIRIRCHRSGHKVKQKPVLSGFQRSIHQMRKQLKRSLLR